MRKVLTGPGPDGRSTILSDEPIAELAPDESRAATEIWVTPALPPEQLTAIHQAQARGREQE
jgi:hypothetical protein